MNILESKFKLLGKITTKNNWMGTPDAPVAKLVWVAGT